jgi:hypothetical protein
MKDLKQIKQIIWIESVFEMKYKSRVSLAELIQRLQAFVALRNINYINIYCI